MQTRPYLLAAASAFVAVVHLAPAPARGASVLQINEAPLDRMIALNNRALTDIRILHFQAARYWLEMALTISETADLGRHETTARTYVHLAVVCLTGYKDREAALDHFLSALRISPNITITPGFETPALRSTYLQAREQLELPPSPDLTVGAPGQEPSPETGLPLPPTGTPEPNAGEVRGDRDSIALAEDAEGRASQRLLEAAGIPSVEAPDPPARLLVPLYCPLPFEVPHGQPLLVRCLTQRQQKRSSVVFYYRRAGESAAYVALPMQQSPKGWLAAVIPGDALRGQSLSYYAKAEIPGVEESVYFGYPEQPNALMVKPPKTDLAGEGLVANPSASALPRNKAGRATHRRSPGTWWFALGGGSGVAYHGRGTVDSNTRAQGSGLPVSLSSGFSPAGLLQLEPEIGYQLSRRISVSIMGRYQIAPEEDYGPAPTTGEKEVRTWAFAGFARVQYSFGFKSNWQPHISTGLGFGTSFLATVSRHCPSNPCTLDHSDTLHGGPVGLTAGVGILYQIGPKLGIFADINEIATLPKVMALTELSIGIAYTLVPPSVRGPARKMAPNDADQR